MTNAKMQFHWLGDTHSGSTVSANDSGGNLANDVFYKFTGNGVEEVVTISLCGSTFDTALKVYTDCTLTEAVVMNDDSFDCGTNAIVNFTSDGTSTYIILIEDYEGFGEPDLGNYEISVTCNLPPVNDDCENAIPLSCGDTETGSTLYAHDSGGNVSTDVFYSYAGNGTEELVTVSLCNSDYDTVLRVFSDCTLTNEIAMSEDYYACGDKSQLSFVSDGTSTYIILVEGYEGILGSYDSGDFEIAVTCGEVPPYCIPQTDCTLGDVITNVTFEDLVNESTCSPNGYNDFTSMVANVEAGQTYPISVTVGNGWDYETTMVWIDFNNNGEFEESEFYFIGSNPGTTHTADISIPEGTEPGQYRMRVRVASIDPDYFDLPTLACDENIVFGETEDYTINVEELGLNDLNSFDFTYHPNPVKDVLNISSKKSVENVSVFNLAGQKVLNNAQVSNNQVDVNSLTPGTYVFKVTLEGGQIETFKIIKK